MASAEQASETEARCCVHSLMLRVLASPSRPEGRQALLMQARHRPPRESLCQRSPELSTCLPCVLGLAVRGGLS